MEGEMDRKWMDGWKEVSNGMMAECRPATIRYNGGGEWREHDSIVT